MEAGAALVEALIDAGLDTAFTVPGESFLPVLEAMRRHRNRIQLVSVRQEGGGAFAAHAYGALSGRPAAIMVSRGPGAANASIGLHAALQDSVPMVLLIGHVRSHMRGREAFQEIDPASMFASMSKAVLQPERAEDVADAAREAVRLSLAGRPGPVVLVVPRDFGEIEVTAPPEKGVIKPQPVIAGLEEIAALAAAVQSAKRPLILAGELARSPEARVALEAFAEASGAPVLAAYRCQDVMANTHAAYAGHLEINPVAYQDQAFAEADLIVVAGSRLDGITSREEKLADNDGAMVLIHPDRAVQARFANSPAISKGRTLVADVTSTLSVAAGLLTDPPADRLTDLLTWREGLHDAFMRFSEPGGFQVHGAVDLAQVIAEAAAALPDDAVVATDGGSYARWIHRYFRFRTGLTQGGTASGAMGAGVPGGIGAALAKPGAPIVVFCGDGGFMMSGQELSTAAREEIPIKVIVCDNDVHGSILKGQLDKYGEAAAYATRMGSPDFGQIARGYGVPAWRVEMTSQWDAAFRAALAHEGPALVHVICDARDIAPYGNGKDAV